MPNIKSSIRSVKTDAERRAKNAPIKAAIRNAARKVVAVTETGSPEEAKATFATATGLIDKASRKGIIHKNAANRKKSRLAKKSQCYGLISTAIKACSFEQAFYFLQNTLYLILIKAFVILFLL